MPRIKRYHPVSHDLNRDPEILELRQKFGDWMVLVWLEMLSWGDRNDGELKGDRGTIEYLMSALWRSNSRKMGRKWSANRVAMALQWMQDKGWIRIEKDRILIANYVKYHPSRDAKENPEGKQTASLLPSFLPNLPNLSKKKEEENRRSRGNGSPPALAKWPQEDLWLKTFLGEQTLLPQLPDQVREDLEKDYPWWDRLAVSVSGLDLFLIQREFAKMGNYLSEKPTKTPTMKGWKRFIRGWLERAREHERRFTSVPRK